MTVSRGGKIGDMSGKRQIIVGLVGQICAGKSAVADAFKRRGAMIYDADKAVHEIYRAPEVIDEVRKMLGDGVIDPAGQVDRKAVGKIVFSDAEKLQALTEKVIFPRTRIHLLREIEKFRGSDAPALVLDAPTLMEARRDGFCDYLLFVAAPLPRRREWAVKRGWSEEELKRRESRLLSESEKRKRSTAILDNAGTLEDLDRKVESLFNEWTVLKAS